MENDFYIIVWSFLAGMLAMLVLWIGVELYFNVLIFMNRLERIYFISLALYIVLLIIMGAYFFCRNIK